MIANENPIKIIGIIGLCAVSGTTLALGSNIKDWRWISTFASIGCVLGASYLNYGKPLIQRFIIK